MDRAINGMTQFAHLLRAIIGSASRLHSVLSVFFQVVPSRDKTVHRCFLMVLLEQYKNPEII